MEYGIFVLTRANEKDQAMKKEYFLCIDNRPLVNLKDADMTPDELKIEQKAFYDEFRFLMESHSNEKHNYLESYKVLKFTGKYFFVMDKGSTFTSLKPLLYGQSLTFLCFLC